MSNSGDSAHELEQLRRALDSSDQQLRDANRQLERITARYADLYDSAPIGYCTLSPTGMLLEVNLAGARLLGGDRDRLLAEPLTDRIAASDRPLLRAHLARCSTTTEPVSTELSLAVAYQAPRALEIVSTPQRGQVEGFRTVLTDLTDQKRTEETQRTSVRMREDFLAIVSHDLRNPLNNILMATEVLLRRLPAQERRSVGRRQLEGIKSASRRMTKLLADLLDLSSMDAGHLSLEPRRHDVGALIESALELIAPMAAEKLLNVVHVAAAHPLIVFADRERTIQVLLNLLTNAVRFTPERGTITIEAHSHPDGIVTMVRDTGTGIAPHQLPGLFRPYWQADKTVKIGTGLGLSIAKGIVECQGGRMWAESVRDGGSAFYFTVPSSTGPVETVVAKPLVPVDVSSRTRKRVMLVDDEEGPRETIAMLLEGEGYEVVTAENGRVAMESLRGVGPSPTLILLDLVMPEMDGLQFLDWRKVDPVISRIPVVVVSGRSDAAKLTKSYELTSWLEKPVSLSELLERLEHPSLQPNSSV